jgi:hypothetical protein
MGAAGSLRIGFNHPELFGTVSSTAAPSRKPPFYAKAFARAK